MDPSWIDDDFHFVMYPEYYIHAGSKGNIGRRVEGPVLTKPWNEAVSRRFYSPEVVVPNMQVTWTEYVIHRICLWGACC